MINKITSMYFSATSTSKKIIRAVTAEMANALNVETVDMSITYVKERVEAKSFGENDLLVLALPVYGGRIPEAIEAYVQSIKGNNTAAVVISVYGNRDFDDALLEMKNILSENSFNVIAAGAFIGVHSFSDKVGTSRPDAADLALAKDFGAKVAEKIKSGNLSAEFAIKGNFPYKDRNPVGGITPLTSDTCIACGVCIGVCPMEAISGANPALTDGAKCMRCAACVRVCPMKARSFAETPINNAIMWLEGNCTARREPEIFM